MIMAVALALVMAAPLMAPAVTASVQGYKGIDLGTLGGSYSQAYDVNDKGMVVGGSWDAYGYYHAFKWSKATGMVDLNPFGSSLSSARTVNNKGDIAGTWTPDAFALERACLWRANGEFVDLGALFGGDDTMTYPTDINEHGCVVGRAYSNSDVMSPSSHVGRAVMWSLTSNGYVIRDLGTLPGGTWAWAYGINERDEVVGMSETYRSGMANPEVHAFKWTLSGGMKDIWHAEGLSQDQVSAAFAINDYGQIVLDVYYLNTYTGANYIQSGYLFRKVGSTIPIGPTFGGKATYARELNNNGDVVGAVWTSGFVTRSSLMLPFNGRPLCLGSVMGGADSWAMSINNLGQVTGGGQVSIGGWIEYHAILWSR